MRSIVVVPVGHVKPGGQIPTSILKSLPVFVHTYPEGQLFSIASPLPSQIFPIEQIVQVDAYTAGLKNPISHSNGFIVFSCEQKCPIGQSVDTNGVQVKPSGQLLTVSVKVGGSGK